MLPPYFFYPVISSKSLLSNQEWMASINYNTLVTRHTRLTLIRCLSTPGLYMQTYTEYTWIFVCSPPKVRIQLDFSVSYLAFFTLFVLLILFQLLQLGSHFKLVAKNEFRFKKCEGTSNRKHRQSLPMTILRHLYIQILPLCPLPQLGSKSQPETADMQ